jgi:hypothetical protein
MVSVIEVTPLDNQRLMLRFDDGSVGQVDMASLLPDAALTRPLREPTFFRLVDIYPGGDGIFWPNEFDLAADMLHDIVHGEIAR